MAKDREYDIIVNLEERTVEDPVVTYDQITKLAFPDKVDNPNIAFKVTYRKAKSEPHNGTMVETDSVEVKKDDKTSFTVVHATKS